MPDYLCLELEVILMQFLVSKRERMTLAESNDSHRKEVPKQ